MRRAAEIKPWLSINKMYRWLQGAPDQGAWKRRMAVWLTHTGKLNANKVAEVLGVSVGAVWLWIKQYNTDGPDGLERAGRGGRRWGFLSLEAEAELLGPFIRKARGGEVVKTSTIKEAVEERAGRGVSWPYVYRLLERHGWSDMIAQSHPDAEHQSENEEFRRISQPWMRDE